MIKHILFDADGVVIHSKLWSIEYARRAGIDPGRMKSFFDGVFQDCLVGKVDLKKAITPYLQEWKYEGPVEKYLEEWFSFDTMLDMRLIEKIGSYRKGGIQCHLATNQEKYRLAYFRDVLKLGVYFDTLFASSEIRYKKPEEGYYTHILEILSTKPEDVLYYDDSEKNIEMAGKIGIKGILYSGISSLVEL